MLDGRKRTTTFFAALSATAVAVSLLVSSPSAAEPNITDVRERVQTLYHEAEQASERYNDVRLELEASQRQLTALQADLRRHQERVEQIRDDVAALVVSQYQGQALSTTAQVALAGNPDEFLTKLATVSAYNDQQLQMMSRFVADSKQLQMRQRAARLELADIRKLKQTLAAEKAKIEEKAAAAEDLLSELETEAARRAAAAEAPSRSGERMALTSVATSGSAGAAVDYALAQVGDAYSYGATGESAFDCSGLTMRAWAQGGVSLPHSSSAQLGYGSPVSSSDLQPGDLVFYYSPVSHVGIYIGNGQIVHAANPSTGVQITGVFTMPLTAARRVG